MSKVYIYRFSTDTQLNKIQKNIKILVDKIGLDGIVNKHDLSAIKLHIGEKGLQTYVNPDWVEPVVRKIKALGARPFLTDTNVLYKSERDNAISHLHLAKEHGFTISRTGAPMIIADGIAGKNETDIEINAPLNEKVALATELVNANSSIVITHVTGHVGVGFGATIKNMGMGMASRKGKLVQHSVSKPKINRNKCTGCEVCYQWCPVDAISMPEGLAKIDEAKCIGCGECLAVCRFDAVKFQWDSSTELLQKQIVEHAYGIVKNKGNNIGYLSFMVNMTKDCDCMAQEPHKIIDDIGVIAGNDPVALDQAALDLTQKEGGKNISNTAYPNINSSTLIDYAEKIGLGSRKYDLVEIDK